MVGTAGSRGSWWGGSARQGYLEGCRGSCARLWENRAPVQLSWAPDESLSCHLAAVPLCREEGETCRETAAQPWM